jgi:CRP/FNR family transcriptional regulator, cyclic AMP receptor protein
MSSVSSESPNNLIRHQSASLVIKLAPLSTVASSVEILETVPLFKGLENAELKALANLSKPMSFRGGEAIVKEGEAGLGFYVIVNGRADVKRKNKTLATLPKGSFFGELALLDDQPRSADVIATEPTDCLVILRWNFWSLLGKNKKVTRGLLEEMARRLRAAGKAMSE